MIRDRNKELVRIRAGDLIPNPRNWRRHPKAQADAMRGVLADVGFAGAAIARQTPEGLMLLDGHLRAELDPDAIISVIVLDDDVTDEEAAKILLTHERLGRRCYAIEIEPRYVDVAVRRWEQYTGQKAVLDGRL